ncbi:hypothetical protein ACLOJK_015229 [Asimina triloba]
MSFPQTTLDDDALERSGSFVSGENQDTKDFYVEKGSSCGRKVLKKPQKEGVSTMFESLLIARGGQLEEVGIPFQKEKKPLLYPPDLESVLEIHLLFSVSIDRSAAGAVSSCVARRRSGVTGKKKIRE